MGCTAAALHPEAFLQAAETAPTGVELEHGALQGLGLAHGIGQEAQCIQPLGLLQGLLEIEVPLLEGPHGQAGLGGAMKPAGRMGHILHPIELGLVPQHAAQIVLLLLREAGQLLHQGGHGPGREQVLGGALADLLGQQRAGGGEEIIRESPHLLSGDRQTSVGGLTDHLLHLRLRLGRFQKGPLGKLIHAVGLQ